ncbi:DUF2291 family protein [uncultured Cohaesibacter sp.]|uniref:DUF2291 family protein n=1 Tax=uncultured Cohaesibacter sp. TaxID=1002546 RepID=UPI00293118C8|nr:DUF2291 family protein [uncultured Cohaesibacter sp.]
MEFRGQGHRHRHPASNRALTRGQAGSGCERGPARRTLRSSSAPIIKGTALRDAASFFVFTDFRDQIEFAKLARALNDIASAAVTLPEGDLIGKKVTFTGAFSLPKQSDPILLVPVQIAVED